MEQNPKISILMPVYNVEKYLNEAIDSILAQTYTDFELLLLDDCSTDRTANIIHEYADPRIRYHRNEKNLGLAENLNIGIRLSKGEYIARMDGDDISLPDRLEKQVQVLNSHPEIGICGTSYEFFGTKNSKIIQPAGHEEIKVQMLLGCCVTLIVARKEIFEKEGLLYQTEYFPAEDYKMWSDCLHLTRITNLQEILFRYRMHEEQISTEKQVKQKQKADRVRMEMIDWLSPNFSEIEKDLYCHSFATPSNLQETDFVQCVQLKKKIMEENAKYNNFDYKLLDATMEQQLSHLAYIAAINLFSRNYSVPAFLKIRRSPMNPYISFKLKMKLLIKSLLYHPK